MAPSLPSGRFACTSDDDCVAPHVCLPLPQGFCSDPDGGAGGGTAGGGTATGGGGATGGGSTGGGGATGGGTATGGGATGGGASTGGGAATGGGAGTGGGTVTGGGAGTGGGGSTGGGAGGSGGGGVQGPVCSTAGWCWSNPLPHGNRLLAVWGTGTTAWAVGEVSTLQVLEAGTWSLAHPPDQGKTVFSVFGTSPSDVWAGAENGVLHYAGSSWARAMTTSVPVNGVWAAGPNEAWAVEDNGVINHFASGGWGAAGGTTISGAHLYAIYGTSASDVWAVGGTAAGGAVAQHWDGSAWASRPTPAGAKSLRGVWGSSSTTFYAVGDSDTVLTWNNTSQIWETDTRRTTTGVASLAAISGSGPSEIWAVGERSTLLHFNGSTWSFETGAMNSEWRGITRMGADFLAVGTGGASMRRVGTTWTQVNRGPADSLYGVFGFSPTDIWAVGDQGVALHWDGGVWSRTDTGTTNDLKAVWGTDSANVWSVGLYDVFQWDRGSATWGSVHTAGSWLYAVRGVDAGAGLGLDLWVAGAQGVIEHLVGGSWSPTTTGVSEQFNAIFPFSSSDVWAVGEHDTVAHWDGGAWAISHALDGSVTLNGLWGTSSSNLYAVGFSGVVVHYDGTRWVELPRGPSNYYDLFGLSPTDMYLAGYGELSRFDGGTFVREESSTLAVPAQRELFGFWASSPNDRWAVGAEGAILHHQ